MNVRALATPLALVIAATALPRGAFADEPPVEAKQAFADGKQAYERGDFETALRLFQRAESLAPAPSLHYNIGMAEERLGRYDEAGGSFDKYLSEIPPPRDDNERAFQDNLRTRAGADHERAKRNMQSEPPPQPLVTAPPPTYAPYYGYMPYGYAPIVRLPKAERIAIARRHRNNGIALLAVGGALLVAGIAFTGVAVHENNYEDNGGTVAAYAVAASVGYVVGITLVIPGAVATARWQSTLKKELRSPEDNAVERRAGLDLAAPGKAMSNIPSMMFAAPAFRF